MPNKMNPEFKAKWVAALRSGDYKQTRNALQDSTGYCCLGVACEVGGLAKGEPRGLGVTTFIGADGEEKIFSLPGTFQRAIGLDDAASFKLVSMNDGDGASFAQIADYIETNL